MTSTVTCAVRRSSGKLTRRAEATGGESLYCIMSFVPARSPRSVHPMRAPASLPIADQQHVLFTRAETVLDRAEEWDELELTSLEGCA